MRGSLAAPIAFALVLALASGCSLGLNTHNPTPASGERPRCSANRTAPVLDFIASGALILAGSALGDEGAAVIIGGVGVGALGLYGLAMTGRCRENNRRWQSASHASARLAKRTAAPKVEATDVEATEVEATDVGDESVREPREPVVAGPPDRPDPRPAPTAPDCAAGGTCPPGSVCDPLAHLCRERGDVGLEGSRCGAARPCDAGLHCDRRVGTCQPGATGREGGRCDRDGGCDDGFTCASGACVRTAAPMPGG